MKITLPVLIEESRRAGSPTPMFSVRALFFPSPIGRGEYLSRAVAKLTQELRKKLDELGKFKRHDALLRYTFCPAVDEHHLKSRILLSHGSAECRVLVVTFESLGRRVGMMPALPGRWFEIIRGQKVLDRAREVLLDHLEQLQKESDKFQVPDEFTARRKQWVSTVDLSIDPSPRMQDTSHNALLAMLGGPMKMSGRAELMKVGRCLDWLYPQELDRPVLRDSEVAELLRLLSSKDRRPVLIVGEPLVGKTAVIHECVYRRVQKDNTPHVSKQNVWLLSPQRLISGMMFVGQWESRVTAIMDEAIDRDHVLYFDDVMGLFYAGRSRDSDLTVANVIKPYIERHDFRMLAEITPAAFRALQERDRGFADLFHVLPIRPTTETQTRKILFDVRRSLEGQHKCQFGLDVLPLVQDLGNRYLRESAQPGKSAQFYRQLAQHHLEKSVGRAEVLSEFQRRSGLSLEFLDDHKRLQRAEIMEALASQITGQQEAVAAMADAVVVAKARLNDPNRPLATFLFLGPTGVGKTQCAKALAEYLFGDAKRMLRFDMNEYFDAAAVARLNGTAWEPEGLLTAAIRRQPFSVVLLDEIEKAHPAVFDLLLQVLGEGRLTDALGRTADFGNAIIIMTSNLGARQAGAEFGLRTKETSNRQAFITAAENFFRPEFFNRLDRIVPFERLTRREIGQIAHRLIGDVLHRDGLVHRRCVMSVDAEALEKVVDEGYHPQLGARALKRAIERQLTGPVAAHLAGVRPDAPAVIHLYPAEAGIAVRVDTLVEAAKNERTIDLSDWADVLDRAEAAILRIENTSAENQNTGAVLQGNLSTGQLRYLAVREYAAQIENTIQRLDEIASAPPASRVLPAGLHGGKAVRKSASMMDDGDVRLALRASADLDAELDSLEAASTVSTRSLPEQLMDLLHATALLQAMATVDSNTDRCLIWLRSPNPVQTAEFKLLITAYGKLFPAALGFVSNEISSSALLLEMPGIANVMAIEHGTHLFNRKDQLIVVQAIVLPLGNNDAAAALEQMQSTDKEWRQSMRRGGNEPDPFPVLPVIRTYNPADQTKDLRSGINMRGLPGANDFRLFILSQLPLPSEFDAESNEQRTRFL